MGYDLAEQDAADIIHNDLFNRDCEAEIAEAANLTKVSDRGYAEFLDGLCALEEFDEEPTPEDVTETLNGEIFRYLVCYEGEYVGEDPDEGWPLFRPTRIVWTHDTGSTTKREKII